MTNEQVENVMAIAFELARIREEHGAQSGMYLSEVRALRAEVERLAAQAAPTERDAQDAARYRWLRSVPNAFKAQRIVNDTPHGMDATIDAAMNGGNQ